MLNKLLLKQANRLIAINKQIKSNYSKLGISETRVVYIPNGVDTKKFCPAANKEALRKKLGLPLNTTILIFTGRLMKQKGLDTLIKAFAKLESIYDNVFLLVVGGVNVDVGIGNTKQREADLNKKAWAVTLGEACDKAANAGVKNIKFTGFVDNVADFLAASDIFVFPSLTEGMSNSLLEAMSWGLAIVASDIAANTAVVEDGTTGLLFEVKDAGKLLACLIKLLENPLKLKKLAKAARIEVKKKYGLEQVLNKYLELITQ